MASASRSSASRSSRHRAQAAHGQAGARERLAVDELLVEPELQADLAHLVLEQQRSGSTSLNFIDFGSPPTLWWLLITADGPRTETDSITSG